MKNRNYEIFNNLNKINNINNIIINGLKNIINEKEMMNKFNKIYNLYYKIKDNQIQSQSEIKNNEIYKGVEAIKYKNHINLIYKTEDKGKYKIFGEDFVKNNKNNIELLINGIKSELIEEFDLKKGNNNIKLFIKNNLVNLSYMFKE